MLDDVAVGLRDVIRVIVDKAAAAGIETLPTTEIRYSWWEGSLRGGAHLHKEACAEASLRALFDRIGGDAAEREITELASRVGKHDETHRWSPLFLRSEWKLIDKYFQTTAHQLRVDDAAIRSAVEEYESAVTNAPYALLTTVLWRDFIADEPFALDDDVQFRPILPADYKIIGRESPFVALREEPLIPTSTDWVCEIREGVPGQGHGAPVDTIQRVISAVALSLNGRAEARLVSTEFENPFLRTGRLSNPAWFATSRLGDRVHARAESVPRLREVYALLRRIDEADNLAYLRIPMRRFRSSAARPTDEDMLIDFVIALESLLAPDSQNIEVTFRFRLRGAAVLQEIPFGRPNDRLHFMSSLYRARSRVVHGQHVHDLRDLATRAEVALKEIFMWFATHPAAELGGQAIVDDIDCRMVGAVRPAS